MSQPNEDAGALPRPVSALTRRGLATRARLVAAARSVFERDGFVNARITDIADAAGVAHGTFYTYFASKEAMLREVIVDLEQELLGRARGGQSHADHEDVMSALVAANRLYLEVYRDHSALMEIWDEAARLDDFYSDVLRETRRAFARRSARTIRALQAEGRADPEIDAAYAAFALTGMVSRFAHNWFARGEPFDFERAVDQLSRLWANAIGLRGAESRQPSQPSRPSATTATSRRARTT